MARHNKRKNIQWQFPVEAHVLGGAFFTALSLLIGIFLFSFSATDPSWFYYTTEKMGYINKGGAIGAHVSALLFYYVGWAAYLCVPCGLGISWMVWTKQSFSQEWDRAVASIVCIFTSSVLLYIHRWGTISYMIPGGLWGQNIYHWLYSYIPSIPLMVGLYATLFACGIVITRMSFMVLFFKVKDFFSYLIFQWRAWLIPLVKGITIIVKACYIPFVWIFKHLKRIYEGADIEESGQSVFAFEQGERQDKELEQDFWDQQIAATSMDGTMEHVIESPSIFVEEPLIEQKRSIFTEKKNEYRLPQNGLFMPEEKQDSGSQSAVHKKLAKILEEKLERFGVYGTVSDIKIGPVVTLFEYQPDIDAKVSKILALQDDLALALEAMSVRIVAPIPGTSRVGFEVANKKRCTVFLRDSIRSAQFKNFTGALPVVLGHDTVGQEVIVDLADMPHLLVAGSTGAGKSVALNTLLVSLLCRLKPDELKLIIIDPKRLEFSAYHDIPHLLFPIITKPHKAAPILKWLVKVMEERYEKMARCGARNIGDYKKKCKETGEIDELPYIVLMIDELADLMIVARKEIEESIARLAQMARASGIHLVLATQRPSVDVITGVIKVNFPSRISFRVTSKVDSRTILDALGAETLLGKGDMLFMDAHSSRIKRVHGSYVTDAEINAIARHAREQAKVKYMDIEHIISSYQNEGEAADEPLLPEVIQFVDAIEEISISLLQRRFKIGYNRSARIIELLEMQGKIMPASGTKMRKVIK